MTLADDVAARPVVAPWRPRSAAELAQQREQAVGRFASARAQAEQAAQAAAHTREMRMDVGRALDVTRREQEALTARVQEQRSSSPGLPGEPARRRVVIAHRSGWFVQKVVQALDGAVIEVVARLDNGADAVGLAVAEQPDLVLVEDILAMVPGEQVVREVRSFCPDTVLVGQVSSGGRVAGMLGAGAATVLTRQVPPEDVAQQLRELVGL